MNNKRVNSLKKEENRVQRKCKPIAKLRLNLADDIDKNISKIIRFYGSQVENLKEYTIEDIESIFKFEFFNVKVSIANEDMTKTLRNNFLNRADETCIKFDVTSIYDESNITLYSVLGQKLTGAKYTKAKYKRYFNMEDSNGRTKATSEWYRILDFNYILGYFKMLDESFGYYLSRDKYLSIDGEVYTFKDAIEIINFDNYHGITVEWGNKEKQRERWNKYYNVVAMIRDAVIVLAYEDNKFNLMDKYNKDNASDYAKSYQTKKNIPDKILNIMNHNVFLKDFKYVEADELTDIAKFKEIEKEYLTLRKVMNIEELAKNEPTLRFRRLGKLRCRGAYYSDVNCICIDIKSPSSFMHEFGHLIDFTSGGEFPLSLTEDFTKIGVKYSQAFMRDLNKLDSENPVKSYLQRKVGYFTTPTEMFARSFEIYLFKKGYSSSFTKESEEDLTLDQGYPELADDVVDNIINYFDKIIKIKSLEEINNSDKLKDDNSAEQFLNLIEMADKNKNVNVVFKSFKSEKQKEESYFYKHQAGIQLSLF